MRLSQRRFLPLLALAILWAEPLSTFAADVVWTNTSGGTWATAGNWNPNQAPGSTDTAWITNNETYTVTVDASTTVNALNLGGTTGTQTLNLASGTFTVTTGGSGTASGTLSLTGATLAGSGLLALAGPLNWSRGTISGWVQCNGGTIGNSGNAYLSGGTLVNTGALTDLLDPASVGSIWMAGSSVISNLTGATFGLTANGNIINSGGGTVWNYGLFRKSVTSGISTIGVPFNNFGTVEADSGTLSLQGGGLNGGVNAAMGTGQLDFGGGTHTLNASASLSGTGTVGCSAGTVNFSGTSALTGTNLIDGGTLNFSNATPAVVGALTISSGTLGGGGPVAASGPLNWSGGTISGWVQCNGGTIGNSGNVHLSGGTLVNTGALTDFLDPASVGSISMAGSSVISNLTGATFGLTANGNIINSGGGTVWNYGLFRKSVTSGISAIGVPFNNFGTVEADSGTLSLQGGGLNGGVNAAMGAGQLDFGGGTHTLNASASLSGTGTVGCSAGIVNFSGTSALTGTNLIDGGTLNFSNAAPAVVGALTISSGTLGGGGPVAASGPLNWSGGTISGWVQCNGGTIGNSGNVHLSGGTLVNTGALTDLLDPASVGSISMAGSSVISNLTGATFGLTANGNIINSGGGTVWNYGLFRKSVTSGISAIGVPFNNFGTVEADSGTLSLQGGGLNGGVNAAMGAGQLDFGGGTHTLNASASLSGTGTVGCSAGTVNFSGTSALTGTNLIDGGTLNFSNAAPAVVGALTISSGTLGGGGPVAASGPLNWSGGTISGWVQCNGGTIGNSGNVHLSGGTLVNTGALTDFLDPASVGSISMAGSSVISNLTGATFGLTANGNIINSGGGTVWNYGLFRKSVTSGISAIGVPFNNFGTVEAALGTLAFSGAYVQAAGGTKLDGGSISISGSSFEIQGGGLSGSNTVTGSVDVGNAGAVNPGSPIASLQVTGNYANAGSLNIALGGTTPGTGFDVLTVGGAATIAGGTLNVSLANGFMPSANMSFVFLNAASILGTFNTVQFPTNLGGLRMQLTYTSTSVTIGISPLPYVSAGPTNQTVPPGGTVNLSVSAGGLGPFGYQWLKDGRLLPGATDGTLTISNAGVTNSGAYSAVVTNGYGMAISLPALVTVGEPDLFGWGDNFWGQLGDGTGNSWPQPVVVRCGVVSVADGYGFSLHLRDDGTLWAAGENSHGQLGDGTLLTRSNAVPVIGGTNVVAVAAGDFYTLFLKSNGTLWAMGRNEWNDFISGPGFQVSNAVPVTSISNVVAMALGDEHELFLKADGTLWAMGYNASGQLGNGTGVIPAGPTAVPGGTNVVAIAAGTDYSLFLKMDGTVWGMGYNAYGELGDGTLVNRSNAVAVIGATNVVAIAAGAYHSMFLKADGALWAVGDDTSGELGDNNTANGLTIRSNAVAVIGGTDVVAMAAGNYDSWFVKADGTLWGMGDDESGGLGDGDIYGWKVVPVALTNLVVANILSSCQSGNAFATGLRATGASLPIVLSSPASPQSGGATINFTNTAGLSFSILAATNLALPANDWTWLGVANETSPGQFQFTDPVATNIPQRFYRARCP